MAFTPLLLMAIVATLALGVNAVGSCASDCYGFVTTSIGCGDSGHALDCVCKTYKDPEALIKFCANKCLGAWDNHKDTMICPHIEAADGMATSPGHQADGLERISLEDIIANIPEYDHHSSSTLALDSIALARSARQRRRAVVAGVTVGQHAEHTNAESASIQHNHNREEAGTETVSQPSSASLLKRSSLLSKRRDGGDRPKWQPTVCTAPGVTCAGGGDGGSGTKVEVRDEADSSTEIRSSRLAKRTTQPVSKLPNWWPLLCTTFGVTCAQSGDTGDESTSNDSGSSSVSEVKREAQPLPVSQDEPKSLRKIPPWHPTSCTSPGITCADSSDANANASGTSGEIGEPKSLRKIPPWHPTSCTAPGITCGDNGHPEKDNSGPDGEAGEPVLDDKPKSLRVIPPWHPTSCTAPGITCADNGHPKGDTSDTRGEAGKETSAASQDS